MYDHDEEEDDFSPEDAFATGDDIVMWADRGLELGFLLGFSDHGIIWRRTHKRTQTGTGENDWEFEPLQRSILTFTRWSLIERLESHEEVAQEHELGMFTELLSEVADAGDFAAVTQAATEDSEESSE